MKRDIEVKNENTTNKQITSHTEPQQGLPIDPIRLPHPDTDSQDEDARIVFEDMYEGERDGHRRSGDNHYGEYGHDDGEYSDNSDYSYNYDDSEGDNSEYSFDFDFDPDSGYDYDPFALHDALRRYLRIVRPKSDPLARQTRLTNLYECLSGLCDPHTQPSDTGPRGELILSLDLVSDIVIAMYMPVYRADSTTAQLPRFSMAYDLSVIVARTLEALRCGDEATLSDPRLSGDHWQKYIDRWTPDGTLTGLFNIASEFHRLKIVYTVCSVAVMALYKLYRSNGSITLNPFLFFLLRTWKLTTQVIRLGIEVDRRDEQLGFPGYPDMIRYVIKGASGVRSAVALILNNSFEYRLHDLCHETLINFMNPWGRRFGSGSLETDVRVFVAALLAVGIGMDDVIALMGDLVPEDRYDEDIRYMFELELDDDAHDVYQAHHKPVWLNTDVAKPPVRFGDEDTSYTCADGSTDVYELHPDCHCVFGEEEEDDDEEEEEVNENGKDVEETKESKKPEDKSVKNKQIKPTKNAQKTTELNSVEVTQPVSAVDHASQSNSLDPSAYDQMASASAASIVNSDISFSEDSTDWRDIVRESNVNITPRFLHILKLSQETSDVFFTTMDEIVAQLRRMSERKLANVECQKIVRSVAWVVLYETESSVMKKIDVSDRHDDTTIQVATILRFLRQTTISGMIQFNPTATFAILDELFMAAGSRRGLIWFLGHCEPNQWLINYFHELLIGSRGNPPGRDNEPGNARIPFSRMGALVLSPVEQSMLMHEFLSNTLINFSRQSSSQHPTDAESSHNRRLLKLICLMMKSLDAKGIVNVIDPDYRLEIQTLLMPWINDPSVPEARDLFFKSQKFSKQQVDHIKEQKAISRRKVMLRALIGKRSLYELLSSHFKPNSTELIVSILHLAMFHSKKSFFILSFFQSLNETSKVFDSDKLLLRLYDSFLYLLNVGIQHNSVDEILGIFKLCRFVDTDDPSVRQCVQAYLGIPVKERLAVDDEAVLRVAFGDKEQ